MTSSDGKIRTHARNNLARARAHFAAFGEALGRSRDRLVAAFNWLKTRATGPYRWFNEHVHVPKKTARQIRRLGPLILILSFLVYLLLGAAAFLFFEHTNHEQTVRKWFFNLIVNRHKFAREMSSMIFNNSRKMLVIVDHDNSERIQKDLVNMLFKYEQQLSLRQPNMNEWTLENSLTYAWGLLTTVGHGNRSPKTRGGQIFALFYCLLGVPFFLITMVVLSYRIFDCCRVAFYFLTRNSRLSSHRGVMLLISTVVYALWMLIFGIILYATAIPENFWRSLYTAVLSSLTIQTADYNGLNEANKLITLAGTTVSLLFACISMFFLTGIYYDNRREAEDPSSKDNAQHGQTNKVAADNSYETTTTSSPKFQVIVDEAGETKLGIPITAIAAAPFVNIGADEHD